MDTKPADIDDYLATVPDAARATLEALRRIIKAVAPDAVEGVTDDAPDAAGSANGAKPGARPPANRANNRSGRSRNKRKGGRR